jgi:hypothetical protein
MKKLLISTALFIAVSAPAYAQTTCTDNGVTVICDPTAFHLSAPGATGSDPVLLNESTTVTLTEVGNHDISQPVRLLFIEPVTTNDVTITGVSGRMASLVTGADPTGAFTFGATSVAALGTFNTTTDTFSGPAVTLSAGQDLVKQIGFNGGAASISYANIQTEYMALGLAVPTVFDVFDAVVPVNFTSDSDFLTAIGTFPKGTVISAIGVNVSIGNNGKPQIDVFDNSWTTAGFVNTTGVPPIPEPSTWLMMLSGFGVFGAFFYRRRSMRLSA